MEDGVDYGNDLFQSFTVYKFEVNPVNHDLSIVKEWKNLTSQAAYKLIPTDYIPFYKATVTSRDYYLVVHLKRSEENVCYYFVKNE